MHENLVREEVETRGSDRSFGLTVGSVLIAMGLYRWVVKGASPSATLWLTGCGAALVTLGWLVPRAPVLKPPLDQVR